MREESALGRSLVNEERAPRLRSAAIAGRGPRTVALLGANAVAVRGATSMDLEAVGTLAQQAFATYGDYSGVLPAWLADPAVQTVIAEDAAGRTVGFAVLGPRWQRLGGVGGGELLALAVAADCRQRGIGRRLLIEIEQRARAARMREIRLSTGVANVVARGLYRSRGFAVLAHVRRFYPSGESALEMAKRL